MSFFNKAVERLAQNSEYIVREGVISWKDSNSLSQPTEAEIDAEIIRLQAEYDAQAYARKREAEYPSVQECVHAILDDQLDALQAKRAEIKTKYPKGG